MAKTNYSYEKRQRELEKKKIADEKARRKAELKSSGQEEGSEGADGADGADEDEAEAPKE